MKREVGFVTKVSFIHCAYDVNSCIDIDGYETFFLSSKELSSSSSSTSLFNSPQMKEAAGVASKVCHDENTIKSRIPIGRCTSSLDGEHCSSSKGGCMFYNRYDDIDDECNVLYDYKNKSPTHYMVCYNQ